MNPSDDLRHTLFFTRLINVLYKSIECVCILCLAGQVVIIAYAVIARYIFSNSPSWAEEISRILMIWMSMLAVSLAVKDGSHVKISFLDKLFVGTGLFVRNLLYSLMNTAFSGILFWKGIALIEQSSKTRLPGSGLPASVMYASICIGGLFMAIMILYKAGKSIWQQKQ